MKTKAALNIPTTLMSSFSLRPIRSDKDMDAANDAFEKLSDQIVAGNTLSKEEHDYMDVLAILISDWEKQSPRIKTFRQELPKFTPQQILQSFMADHKLSQSELARQTGCPQSIISEFIAGKRELSKASIVQLASYFKVSTDLFLPKSVVSTAFPE